MAEPVIRGMSLTDFLKLRVHFERRAVARRPERLNLGQAGFSFEEEVRDEIEIGLLQEMDGLKARIQLLEEMILGDNKG